MTELGRTIRTVRHLSPAQVAHRLRLRGQKHVYPRIPEHVLARRIRIEVPLTGWPDSFQPLDQQVPPEPTTAEEIFAGELTLVGETGTVSRADDWNRTDRSQLWRYHLHYFEWAWALTTADDQEAARATFAELWASWRASHRLGQWDAWSPYVASVRAWALCGLHGTLIAGSAAGPDVIESLRIHVGFLRRNLELDVGGNHLMKNLKGLIGLAVFFDDDQLLQIASRHLERQLNIQVHADGGHFERSPSYHGQVLGDLLDIFGLLRAADQPVTDALAETSERMRTWLATMLLPDGTVPLLKDCVPVSPARLEALGVRPPSDRPRCAVLADSAYVVVHQGRLHAVIDVGPPCPKTLPAHAHADSLSWVLCIDGEPAIVDTGVSTYQDLARRAVERSTAAHNTVEIDGSDSTEVYGSFRAGRRAHVTLASVEYQSGNLRITAEHDGYRHLEGSPRHRRTWTFIDDEVQIRDDVTGSGEHHVASHTHTVSDVAVVSTPGRVIEAAADVAGGMGKTRSATRITAELRTTLPVHIVTRISAPAEIRDHGGTGGRRESLPELPDSTGTDGGSDAALGTRHHP